MTPKQARPRRTIPDPEEAWKHLGAALRRFMDRYELNQAWVAETLGLSQPQVSYLLGRTTRERPRELTPSEMLRMELRVRREIDPDLVLGELQRDAGLIEEVAHPADVVASWPFLDPDFRQDISEMIEKAEARYLARHGEGLSAGEAAPPPRLVRGDPTPRRAPSAAAAGESQPKRRRG